MAMLCRMCTRQLADKQIGIGVHVCSACHADWVQTKERYLQAIESRSEESAAEDIAFDALRLVKYAQKIERLGRTKKIAEKVQPAITSTVHGGREKITFKENKKEDKVTYGQEDFKGGRMYFGDDGKGRVRRE